MKVAMKKVFITNRDEDNAIGISHKFVSVKNDFSYQTTFNAIRDEKELVAIS